MTTPLDSRDDTVSAPMEPKSVRIPMSDGYPLHAEVWTPPTSTLRGQIVALHGIQSHAGWYRFSNERLCRAGYEVVFVDRRGSGRNTEQRGHVLHHDRLIHDVRQVRQSLANAEVGSGGSLPTFLMAVSWGGKPAAVVAARYPDLFDGLALLYPGLRGQLRPRWWQQKALQAIYRGDGGERRIPIPLSDPALFTSVAKWQEFIRTDELALHEASLRFLGASVALEEEVFASAADVAAPILLMLAGQDRVICNSSAIDFVRRTSSPHRTIIEYAGACHTLEFEEERETFVRDLIGWFDRRTDL